MNSSESMPLSITYRHTQHLGKCAGDGVEHWRFEAFVGCDEAPGTRVARGGALLVDLFGEDPYGALDGFGRHIRRIRDVAFDPCTGELDPSWGDELEFLGDRLLLLDVLEVDEEWQGTGVEPLITAMVVTRLRHCAVAALCASRFPDASDITALYAAGLEFRPTRDGVHYLDPTELDIDAVLERRIGTSMLAS